MDEKRKALLDRAWHDARYAKNSYDRNLVYEALGYIHALVDTGICTYDDVREIDTFLIRDGLNNPEWFHEADKRNKV